MKLNMTLMVAAAAGMLLGSCSSYTSFQSYAPSYIGSGALQRSATVVSTYPVDMTTNKNASTYGAITGAAVGAGAGQLLGSGSGRIASTVGFGALGMLLGNSIGDGMGKETAERVTVKSGGKNYTFTQPIFSEFGPLAPGTTGTLYINGDRYLFTPGS